MHSFGKGIDDGIDKIVIEPISCPTTCGDDEVIIKVKAACVNYPDLMNTANAHQHKQELPFTPGMEFAGEVKAVGSKVRAPSVGDRVIVNGKGFADEVIVHHKACTVMPEALSFSQGAAFTVGYTTAYHCLIERANLQKGETVLVNGATGGMGLAAVQIARAIGARVIGTGGADHKLDVVTSQGAAHVLNYKSHPKFAKDVKELTNGEGVDVVYDPVGGDVLRESLSAVRWGGRVLVVGFTSGDRIPLPSNIVLIKGLTVIGCRAGEYIRRTPDGANAVYAPRMKQLWRWAHEGRLVPYISHEFPLEEVRDAFLCVHKREVVGRVCVNMELPAGHRRSNL